MMRFWKWFFLKTLFALTILLAGVYFLLSTQTGSILILNSVVFFTKDAFTYTSIEGALFNNFTLHNAAYTSKEFKASAKNLTLDWSPIKLINKTLNVDVFEADHLILTLPKKKPATQKKPNRSSGSYINNIVAQNIHLTNIYFTYQDKQTIHIKNIDAAIILNKKISTHIKVSIDSPHISNLSFNIEGSLEKYQWDFSLLGNETNWGVAGTGNQNSINFNTNENTLLNSEASFLGSINWQQNLQWDISLKIYQLSLPYLTNDFQKISLDINSKGTPNKFNVIAHQLSANIFNKEFSGSLTLDTSTAPSATKTPSSFISFLTAMTLDLKMQLKFDQMTLSLNGNISDNWQFDYLFNSNDLNQLTNTLKGRVISKGNITGLKFSPQLKANITSLSLAIDALPDTNISSDVDIAILANIDPKQPPSATINANIKNITATHLLNDIKAGVPINGSLTASISPKNLTSALKLFFYNQQNNFIDADFALNNKNIDGKLQAALNEFKILQLLSPTTTGFEGAFNTDVTIKGPLEKPDFSGKATLKNLSFNVLPLAIKPIINLDINTSANTLHYSGNIVSGDGKLELSGTTAFSESMRTNANIKGSDFLASNMLKTKLIISPDLTLSYSKTQSEINGSIFIPQAYFDFGDMRTTQTLPSNTVIILPNGKVQEQDTLDLALSTHIEVTLGENIDIEASGLTGKLSGKLLLQQSPEKNLVGNGQIVLNGSYDLLGESLVIKNGLGNFNNSPIENPSLNVKASKEILLEDATQTFTSPQTLKVGALIQGTVDNPRVTMFSDPAGWSQSDILSLILLGQPASSASGADIQLLAKAAQVISPGGGSFNSLKHQLQQTFGLSDLRIQNGLTDADAPNADDDPETSTSVVLGKYLSPRLYLTYSVGVFNALNTFRLRYQLGRNWFVQTQSNTEGSGVDLLYTRESND